jgi:Protein of unknown function (DUF2786)
MVALSQERRAQFARKIQALLAKTKQAGCTEEEAISAALAAARLQTEYNIDLTEAELIAEGFDQITFSWASPFLQFIEERLIVAVARFTETRGWIVRPRLVDGTNREKRLAYKTVFCGLKSDVLFAAWLFEYLRDYVERATRFYNAMNSRRATDSAFALGALNRIAARLTAEKVNAEVPTGRNALVVLDKALVITNYLVERQIKLQVNSNQHINDEIKDANAFGAGQAAGNAAGLNRPLNQGRKVQQIS